MPSHPPLNLRTPVIKIYNKLITQSFHIIIFIYNTMSAQNQSNKKLQAVESAQRGMLAQMAQREWFVLPRGRPPHAVSLKAVIEKTSKRCTWHHVLMCLSS